MGRALELIRRLETNVGRALVGKPEVVRLAVIGLVARGHLLIEDVPGVGKTTLAAALARSIGAGFQRIQFTSDMLPSDILGVSVWQPETPRISDGSMSEVNWMRWKPAPMDRASAAASVVLPTPGTSSISR